MSRGAEPFILSPTLRKAVAMHTTVSRGADPLRTLSLSHSLAPTSSLQAASMSMGLLLAAQRTRKPRWKPQLARSSTSNLMLYANPTSEPTQPAVSSLWTDKQIQWTHPILLANRRRHHVPGFTPFHRLSFSDYWKTGFKITSLTRAPPTPPPPINPENGCSSLNLTSTILLLPESTWTPGFS